jgi:hypothetical protein
VKLAEQVGRGIGNIVDPEFHRLREKARTGILTPEEAVRFNKMTGQAPVAPAVQFTPQEVEQKFGGETTGERAKRTFGETGKIAAGIGSLIAPTGLGGKAVSTIAPSVTKVGGRALLKTGAKVAGAGAVQAGLREVSEEEATPETVAAQAGAGAAGAAAIFGFGKFLQRGGQAAKVQLDKANKNFVRKSLKKELGAPGKKLGRLDLFDDMTEAGISTNSLEDVRSTAGEVLTDSGQRLQDGLEAVGTVDVAPHTKKIADALKASAKKHKKASLKKPINDVLKEVESDLSTVRTATDLYDFKKDYGILAFDRTLEKAKGNAYKTAYNELNDSLDQILIEAGQESLRPLNRNMNTAFKAIKFADDQVGKEGSAAGLGLLDFIAGGTGFVGGGPLGAAKAVALKRLLLSPGGVRATGRAVGGAGSILEKLSVTPGRVAASPAGVRGVSVGTQELTKFLRGNSNQ